MFVISVSILLMLRGDAVLFEDHPDVFKFMILHRAGYPAVTLLFGMILYRTKKYELMTA